MDERPNNTILLLLGGLAIVIAMVAYFALANRPNPDVLGDNAVIDSGGPSADQNQLCAGDEVYHQIEQILFNDAIALRGTDLEPLGPVAGKARLRMENPVAEGADDASGNVTCSGSVAIDLPAGVTTRAGLDRVMADIGYVVSPADGNGAARVTEVREADQLVGALAGVTIVPEPPKAAPQPSPGAPGSDAPQDPLAPLPDDEADNQAAPPIDR